VIWAKLKGYALMAAAVIAALAVAFLSGWRKGGQGAENELERDHLEQELERQQEGHRQVVEAVEERREVQDVVDTEEPENNRQHLLDRWRS